MTNVFSGIGIERIYKEHEITLAKILFNFRLR